MLPDDPYTLHMRLCDDDGQVSHNPVDEFGMRVVVAGQTFLDRLNNLRSLTAPVGEHRPITTPFVCTGHAHLAGEHIKCTSPAHERTDSAHLR